MMPALIMASCFMVWDDNAVVLWLGIITVSECQYSPLNSIAYMPSNNEINLQFGWWAIRQFHFQHVHIAFNPRIRKLMWQHHGEIIETDENTQTTTIRTTTSILYFRLLMMTAIVIMKPCFTFWWISDFTGINALSVIARSIPARHFSSYSI